MIRTFDNKHTSKDSARLEFARKSDEVMFKKSAMPERVSVIIPTYNRAAEVLRAAQSALAQTLRPHELIIVDDGSTDGTEDAVRTLPSSVIYLRKQNGGVSSARNLGLKHVTGDFVCMCDSDDYWDPLWLESAIRAISGNPSSGAAVCTQLLMVAADGKRLGLQDLQKLPSNGVIPLPRLFLGGVMGSNLCLRTDVLRGIGEYDQALQTAEDIDFGLRIAVATTIVPVVRPFVYVTQTAGSLSRHLNTGNRLRVFRKFEQCFPILAEKYRNELHQARLETTLSYARDLIVARQFPAARLRLRESWSYRPTLEAALLSLKIILLTLMGLRKPR